MTKEIKLQNGLVAIVDDEDFERINKQTWAVNVNESKSTLKIYNSGVREGKASLNQFILKLENDEKVLHMDGDKLNFTKENLLITEQAVISRKRRGNRNSSSMYKGVSWHKEANKWKAQINTGGKVKHLGLFEVESEAAKTYNRAALLYFGEHCHLNEIGEDNSAETFNIKQMKQRRKKNKEGYKGIFEREGKYQARVWDGKKFIYAGVSKDAVEAAKMHDRKAYELFGDKAILNFPAC